MTEQKEAAATVLGKKERPGGAGFFGQDKASNEGCEGVYIGYMTEQKEAAAAVLTKKDKPE